VSLGLKLTNSDDVRSPVYLLDNEIRQ